MKPARFVFRLVARAQSADRVYANQRTSERTNQQRTKQQTTARTNERTSSTKIMPKWLWGRSGDASGAVREALKSSKNRSEELLARPWAIQGLSGRCRNAPERLLDALGTVLGRSRDVPGMAWGAPGRSRDVSKTPWRALGASFSRDLGEKACQKVRRPVFVRFCVARVLSRDSSDVHETSVLVCPKHNRSMVAAHARAHARASKKQPFRPRKSSPGTVRASKIEARRPSSSEKTEPERNAASRAHIF